MSEVGNRPRKSTGSKTSKGTRSSIPATGIFNIPNESTAFIGQQKARIVAEIFPLWRGIFSHVSYVQQGVSLNGVSSTGNFGGSPTPPTPDGHPIQPHRQESSTTDRTTLDQLKTSIRAREAQFVVKGIGNLVVGGGKSPGKKHHSHPATEVPYPRSYEREVVDL